MSIAPFSDSEEQRQQAGHTQEDDAKEDTETNEDSEDDEDEDDDESEDEDEEVIARKLNEQLLEDIRRARADAAPPVPAAIRRSPKEEAAFTTMQTVLAFAASDPLVHATLAGTAVAGSNVLEMLNKIMDEGHITPQIAGPLSHVLVKLAKSERKYPDHRQSALRLPHARALGVGPYSKLTKLFKDRSIKPSRIEVLPGVLAGIPDGLERLGKVNGTKLVARPQETV